MVDHADNVETYFPPRKSQPDEADASAQIPLATPIPQSRIPAIPVASKSKSAGVRLAGGYNQPMEVLATDKDRGLQRLRNKLHNAPIEESAVDLLRALDCIPLTTT